MDNTPIAPLLKPEQAAEFLNVSPHTITFWRLSGTGPRHLKVGKHVRYRMSDLETFLDSSQTTGGHVE